MADDAELGPRLEHHRFYVTRNWQYFGALLLINSVTLNAYDDIKGSTLLADAIGVSSLVLFAVLYHLINWTNMRIDMNMPHVNKLLSRPTPLPSRWYEGLIAWMKGGMVALAIPYVALLVSLERFSWIFGLTAYVSLVSASELIVFRFRKRSAQTPSEPVEAPTAATAAA